MIRGHQKNVCLIVIIIMLCSALMVGCSGGTEKSNKALTGKEVSLSYTSAFKIVDYGDNFTLLTDAEGNQFLLVPEGTETPEISEAAGATVVNTPLKKVVYCSTTQVGLLQAIFTDQEWDSIAAVTTDTADWYVDAVKTRMESGAIQYVGTGGMADPDYEKIQALNPDMVFVYTGDYGLQKTLAKMKELKIPCAVVNDYTEATDLGRLEWLKFLGAFYNKGQEAAVFIEAKAAMLDEIAAAVKDKPSPKVVYGMIYDGKVYIPDGGSYVAKQIKEAGGDYVFAEVNPDKASSSQVTVEEFYAKGKDADVFIYSSMVAYMPSLESLLKTEPLLKDFQSVKNGKVYCFAPWYYMSINKTIEGVKDMASFFHEGLYPDWELVMFQQMPEK
ncbi:ABC transporter substrate-binding protein [Dehalobacter sp. DCM]|uniref:ABC transporter substrate-binding protein n=1 Tax=Dehalobacter sp. DCM TaxID=2907827 RepID=UPI003081E812|nr:ABC transporter substrate-binding protein [Dehalobacter sp. DCM]